MIRLLYENYGHISFYGTNEIAHQKFSLTYSLKIISNLLFLYPHSLSFSLLPKEEKITSFLVKRESNS